MRLYSRSSFVRLLAVMASYSYTCVVAGAPNSVASQTPVVQTLKSSGATEVPPVFPEVSQPNYQALVADKEKVSEKAEGKVAAPAEEKSDAADDKKANAAADQKSDVADDGSAEKPSKGMPVNKADAAAKEKVVALDEVVEALPEPVTKPAVSRANNLSSAAKKEVLVSAKKAGSSPATEKDLTPEKADVIATARKAAPGSTKKAALAPAKDAAVDGAEQELNGPVVKQVAQLSQPKVPSLAVDLSTATVSLDSTLSLDPLTTLSQPTVPSLYADLPTTAGLGPLGTASLTTGPDTLQFNDTLRDTTLDLEQSLLSLPPIGYDTSTSTLLSVSDLLAAEYMDTTATLQYEEATGTLSLASMYEGDGGEFRTDLEYLMSGEGTRKMSLLQTVCRTLAANQALRVDALRPEISNAGIEAAQGEFDTILEGAVGYGSRRSSTIGPRPRSGPDNREHDIAVSRNLDYDIGIRGRRPTGTDYSLSFSGNRNSTNRTYPFYSNDVNLNITQNLLRGAGCEVNLISVWTAQNDFVISLYQLQNTLINLVTDVQKAYWDVYLGYETLKIRRTAYDVAREQRERTEEFVRVGRSAPLDALAAQAEEASRISDIINAVSNLKQRQLVLLRLINPENLSTGWRSLIMPVEDPILPTERLVPEERVRLARYYRPDLRQAQIDLANGELETIRTANGMLPQLDFVLGLGLSGVGDTQQASINRMADMDYRNYQVGLQFSYPLQNRTARAQHRRATFQKMLAEEAVRNFCQIIDVEVRTAILEIERTSRLIISTKVTEELRRRQQEAETEKFRVGRSTQIEVSQAQRDFVQAQLDRVTAEVANINAYLELYRVEGTALQRRGIQPIHITPESGVPAG